MQVGSANGLATLSRIGSALSAEHEAALREPDAVDHVTAYNALAAAARVQDRMLGDLLDAVDRPWLDTRFERRERLRRREAHEAMVGAAFTAFA
jgi:phosphate uptake regulator